MAAQYERVEYDAYGGVDKLHLVKRDAPTPGPAQVLVEVHACSLNPVDYKVRDGAVRMIMGISFPSGIAFDLSGVVKAVGADVKRLAVGDRVAARSRTQNALAELAVVDEAVTSKLPDSVDFVDGAALPLAGQTALQALRELELKEGESVLVCGGSGGVGSFAIQLAKHVFKAGRVLATASKGKHELLKSLGADELIDYRDFDLAKLGKVNVVFDAVGDWRKFAPLVKGGRRVVSVASMPTPEGLQKAGFHVSFPMRGLFWLLSLPDRMAASGQGVEYKYHWLHPNAEDLTVLLDAMAAGKIRALVDTKTQGLANYREAFARIESGRATGKVVIVVR